MEARAAAAAAAAVGASEADVATVETQAAAGDQLLVESVALEGESQQLTGARRKRTEEFASEQEGVAKEEVAKARRTGGAKQSRRHNWQPKYEMEFGLLGIERDAVSGDVLLAMCGFCKAFGREGKYEQLVQADAESGNETKKRRRRSLTTTKFFRAFRVDNIRSHLQGAHPRRWAEYDLLPKQEAVRARFLQLQGELQYDHLPMVDDVLSGSTLNAETEMAYAQSQAQALAHVSAMTDAQQHAAVTAAAHMAQTGPAGLNSATGSQGSVQMPMSLQTYSSKPSSTTAWEDLPSSESRGNRGVFGGASAAASTGSGPRGAFDYEKHLTEQLALDRERLEFEKARFKKEVELRERELALREKHMAQDVELQEKLREANRENAQVESAKFYRLAEVLRESIASAQTTSGASVV